MTDTLIARACGVDFGTSNSTVGWLRPASHPLIPLEGGKTTLPSVIFFNADEESVSVGRAALGEYLDGYEGRLMRSLKSLLGSSLIDGHTEVQGRVLPFRTLLADFLTDLKRRAETHADRGFDQAVFGRPVYFVDEDSAADRQAEQTLGEIARQIGYKDVSFQFEPIAAAFHYEREIDREELVLIADIGGGTSDFSLVRLSPDRAHHDDRREDILANGGVHIGGTDFDKQLSLAGIMPLLGYKSRLANNAEVPASYYFNLATWHTINFTYTRKVWAELQDVYRDALDKPGVDRLMRLIEQRAGHWLALQVEEAKIALSDSPRAKLHLDRLHEDLHHELDAATFELAAKPLVERIDEAVAALLQQAGLAPDAIDTVFFTGGASGVPALRNAIAARVPTARRVEGDLFGSIGGGLAVEAARRYG